MLLIISYFSSKHKAIVFQILCNADIDMVLYLKIKSTSPIFLNDLFSSFGYSAIGLTCRPIGCLVPPMIILLQSWRCVSKGILRLLLAYHHQLHQKWYRGTWTIWVKVKVACWALYVTLSYDVDQTITLQDCVIMIKVCSSRKSDSSSIWYCRIIR